MDGEALKPNPHETNLPGREEPVVPLPTDADQVINRAATVLQEKRAAIKLSTDTSVNSLLDVYQAAYLPQPETTVSLPRQDFDTLSQEIEQAFEEGAPVVSPTTVKEYLTRVDALSTQMPKEIAFLEDVINTPWRRVQEVEATLNAKRQELQNWINSGTGGIRGVLAHLRRRNELQSGTTNLQRQLEKERKQYYELEREDDQRRAQEDQLEKNYRNQHWIEHLKDVLVRKYRDQTLLGIVQGHFSIVEGLEADDDTQQALFEAVKTRIIKPHLNTLVSAGSITGEQAVACLSLFEDNFQKSREETQQSSQPNVGIQTQLMKISILGFTYLDSLAKAVQTKDYIKIFQLLAREEAMEVLSALPERLSALGLTEQSKEASYAGHYGDIAEVLHTIFYPETFPYSDENRRALAIWEIVRNSPFSSVFPEPVWHQTESQLAQATFRYLFGHHVFDIERSATSVHLWSLIKNNPVLRRQYLPEIIMQLGTYSYWNKDGALVRTMLDNILMDISPDDLGQLSRRGFSAISDIKALAERNPRTLNIPSFPDPADPQNREKLTPNPVYQTLHEHIAKIALNVLEASSSDKSLELAVDTLSSSWGTLHGYDKWDPLWAEPPGDVNRNLSIWALVLIRRFDRLIPYDKRLPPPETREQFAAAVNTLRRTLHNPEVASDRKQFLQNQVVLQTLARQPQRAETIIETVLHDQNFDTLAELMSGDGPLAAGRDSVLEEIFSSGKPSETIQELIEGFNQSKPYFEFLFEACRRMHGTELHASTSNYPITEIATPEGNITVAQLVANHKAAKTRSPDELTKLEEMISDPKTLEELVNGERHVFPFSKLHGMWKEQVFRHYLRQSIELSRSEQAKQQADTRHRREVKPRLEVSGIYLHGTAVDNIDAIFLNGNLPSTVLGADPGLDVKNFPFHSEFIRFDKTAESGSLREFIENSRLGIYGSSNRHGGTLGNAGQIFLVYDRNNAAYEVGKDFAPEQGGWPNHRIMLGGMPSTEISGIILRDPSATFAKTMASVVDNGFYIPIYDFDMNLIWTPEQFDEYRRAWNLNIPVPIWDYSFKVGEARGSHKPAGEYALPVEEGVKKYYVKFAEYNFDPSETDALRKEQEARSKIWNEFLANRIYQHFGIPVANTGVVKVNRAYGYASQEIATQPSVFAERPIRPDARAYAHVSEWIDHDQSVDPTVVAQKLKDGFVFDALLANWDIIKGGYNNLATSGGEVIRVDNGGALLFRAGNERKTAEQFGGNVVELDSMRRLESGEAAYPGLTEDDIQNQIRILQNRFRAEDIDSLVDSTRLHETDRNFLKQVLRGRRDYIVSHFISP